MDCDVEGWGAVGVELHTPVFYSWRAGARRIVFNQALSSLISSPLSERGECFLLGRFKEGKMGEDEGVERRKGKRKLKKGRGV